MKKKLVQKIALSIFCTSILVSITYITSTSSINYRIGDLFFGKIDTIYNVRLAKFFFIQSAYPIFGKEVMFSHYQLSRTYFITNKLRAAIDEAEKELELYPENKRTYYILGLTYGYMDEEEKAIEAFEKFLEWKPESWAARNDKAWLEFRIGHIDAALETIEPVSNMTENAWVQNTYGVLLMNKKRYAEAKIAFQNAEIAANKLTLKDWGETYPGNDPRIYPEGINTTKKSISRNQLLLQEKTSGN